MSGLVASGQDYSLGSYQLQSFLCGLHSLSGVNPKDFAQNKSPEYKYVPSHLTPREPDPTTISIL